MFQKSPFICIDWNDQLANLHVLPAKGHFLFVHFTFILLPGKVSWKLTRKVKIQVSPSLRSIHVRWTSYDLKIKVSEASKTCSRTSFLWSEQEQVKTRSISRVSGNTFKLTDSMILCITLLLSIDKHQTLSTFRQTQQINTIKKLDY